jgi:anti-sigma factor RsiW
MSCSPSDLKDYFFGELGADERREIEQHIAACAGCRDELNTLSVTRSALMSVSDEEPARRIAFVSDKVFEPRWWQRIWASGPQLGFASACVLAGAIMVHGFTPSQPQPQSQPSTVVASIDQARIDQAVAKRLDAAVEKAVVAAEDRQAARLLDVVNARLSQSRREYRQDLLLIQDYLDRVQKETLLVRKASFDPVGVAQ